MSISSVVLGFLAAVAAPIHNVAERAEIRGLRTSIKALESDAKALKRSVTRLEAELIHLAPTLRREAGILARLECLEAQAGMRVCNCTPGRRELFATVAQQAVQNRLEIQSRLAMQYGFLGRPR